MKKGGSHKHFHTYSYDVGTLLFASSSPNGERKTNRKSSGAR